MKLIEFNYTKADGTESKRALIAMVEPSKHYSGVDVSHLDADEFEAFSRELRELKNRQYEEIMKLITEHDLKHNYRQFLPDRMTNIETTVA